MNVRYIQHNFTQARRQLLTAGGGPDRLGARGVENETPKALRG